jgi:hypothetical protein
MSGTIFRTKNRSKQASIKVDLTEDAIGGVLAVIKVGSDCSSAQGCRLVRALPRHAEVIAFRSYLLIILHQQHLSAVLGRLRDVELCFAPNFLPPHDFGKH